MELKEYLKIIKKNITLFVGIIIIVMILVPLYFFYQSQKIQAVLNIDITRTGSQQSADYKFDDFYRLQADEKFADTIVEWLKSPSVVAKILEISQPASKELSLNQLKGFFKTFKLSSQVIEIKFFVKNEKEAQKLSQSIKSVIETNTAELNEKQNEESWFKIITRGPIVRNLSFSWWLIWGISLIAGIFVGFWVILFKHYLE